MERDVDGALPGHSAEHDEAQDGQAGDPAAREEAPGQLSGASSPALGLKPTTACLATRGAVQSNGGSTGRALRDRPAARPASSRRRTPDVGPRRRPAWTRACSYLRGRTVSLSCFAMLRLHNRLGRDLDGFASRGVAAHPSLPLLNHQLHHPRQHEFTGPLEFLLGEHRELVEELTRLRALHFEAIREVREELGFAHPAGVSHRLPPDVGRAGYPPSPTARASGPCGNRPKFRRMLARGFGACQLRSRKFRCSGRRSAAPPR